MKHVADLNHLSFKNGLTEMKEENGSVTSRINYKNQWASHPTLNERKKNLDQYELTAEVDETPAWNLFVGQEELKNLLTKQFYKNIPQQEVKGIMNQNEFEQLVNQQFKQFSFPVIFEEYFDNRQIDIFDPNEAAQQPFIVKPFEEVLTKQNLRLPKAITILQHDIALLKSISKKEIDVSSFDFDGKKYSSKDAVALLAQLESELEQQQKQLSELDKSLFRYFCAIAPLPEAEVLKQQYLSYFNERKDADHYLDKVNEMMEAMAPLYSGKATIEQVRSIVKDLKGVSDPVFKRLVQQWLDKNILHDQPLFKEQVEKFLASHYEYFSGTAFFDNELNEFNTIAREMWTFINQYLSLQFKHITEVQAKLLDKKKELSDVNAL
jgi:hypothetical protein